jgi:hypothetical protein
MEMQRILARITRAGDHAALDLLKRDHAAVAELFDAYVELESDEDKETLVARIILELVIHARIEQELFYPSLRRAIGNEGVMDEADVEHALVRQLMADLNGMRADASHYDAKVKALSDLVKHHVGEEEGLMFEEARDSALNLSAIGGQLEAYKAALQSRYELDADGVELAAYLSAPTLLNDAGASDSEHKPRTYIRGAAASNAGVDERGRTRSGNGSAGLQRRLRKASRASSGNS